MQETEDMRVRCHLNNLTFLSMYRRCTSDTPCITGTSSLNEEDLSEALVSQAKTKNEGSIQGAGKRENGYGQQHCNVQALGFYHQQS